MYNRIIVCLLCFLPFCLCALADDCKQTTFDNVQGSTCSIGSLQFTFQPVGGYASATYDLSTGNLLSTGTYPYTSILFSPVAGADGIGFTLANLPTVNSTVGTSAIYSADFYYTISTLNGDSLSGMFVGRVDNLSVLGQPSAISKNTLSMATYPYTYLGLSYDSYINGTNARNDVTISDVPSLFVESEWRIGANDGNTASAGAVTNVFISSVPEPSSFVLIASGAAILLIVKRKITSPA